ncbi:glycoside hydrolase family 125 protein [Spirosoma rhododendri]|uniref:Glycoside hydrolase family 125 protein n=1 Tax=Spirosoma rhododendri TaxID=2728024 RepID=A0A7L5DRD0_9BACT|nr:glycoside hydrolase family 125 protein [Spirosoma rhododendri]QJD81054.1 glycoside hydrolase family 125 protein [Spirosoma rhododendri]
MDRRHFIQQSSLAAAGVLAQPAFSFARTGADFPVVRVAEKDRNFTSPAVEKAIQTVSQSKVNPELAWLFGNCFPNTLDTTVDFSTANGKPDTYVITGDIDAMWLRDSTAQVTPYLSLIKTDDKLRQLIAGVINRQVQCIRKDPYANAFYKDASKVSEWKDDVTDMQPGLHERKWEIDSLCYPVRLAYQYWKRTGDTTPFDQDWRESVALTVKTFREQQRKNGNGPYKFERRTTWATDGVPLGGYGYPAKPNGLICSMFRPSDDATIYPYLIPSNFFAVVSLRQAAEMLQAIHKDKAAADACTSLANEVDAALKAHAVVTHPQFGKIYAYEVNGFGSYNLMDDANVPSLLAMPYLGSVPVSDPIYQNTRRYVLSTENPFFFKGTAGEGIGGPHAGMDMIWPMSIILRALTSTNDSEIKTCLNMLQRCHANTGFMHESFHKNDPTKFTRKWFAWANTLFGELIWKLYNEKKGLLA